MSLYISALGLNKIDLVSTNLENFAYSNVINTLVYNYSNLNTEFIGVSNSLSNYETITNHNLDNINLNTGISNNQNDILGLSIYSSNFETKALHLADMNNINSSLSNNSNAISSLSLATSNFETKTEHSSDISTINAGLSNNTLQINALSVATSNFETILNHNNDISNLNNGYSNNAGAINALSVASSNYITANQNVALTNKTIDATLNTFLNLPAATNYDGAISNLSIGYSNNSNAISSLSVATSNFETIVNHNLDINNLNIGYSNNFNDISSLSIATSNFETIVNHNNDINNLNIGYSNNFNDISSLSIATSNFETIVNHNNDINNLNQGYSNNAGAINALSVSSSNYITANQNVALTNKVIDANLNTLLNLPSSGGSTTNYNYYDSLELGCILDYAGSNAPTGWLLCYGQAVSRTTYSNLYSIIGTTYGVGDGTTTFNLPDYRGRVSCGLDSNAGVVNTAVSLGTKIGEHLHTLSTSEMPNHTHNLRLLRVAGGGSVSLNAARYTTSASYDDYGDLVQSTGSGTPFSNIQPTIVLNKIIKYANNNTITFNPTSILNVYNPYYARVFMAQGHSNLSDNVWTDLELNTVAYGNSIGSFNTGTYTYTTPITGVYRFSLGAQFTNGVVGDTVGMRLLKNGTNVEMTEERSVIRNGTTVDLGVSDIIVLNAGDTIKMQAIGIGSSIIDVSGASYAGGGEDITHFSVQLETATNIVGTSNVYTQVNQNTTQTSSNLVMWAGSYNELLTTQLHITNNSNLGIGTSSALYPIDIIDTTAIRLPKGTTAQRPSNNDALIRYNTTTSMFEGCSNNVWGTLGGSTGGSSSSDFVQTSTKTANYTAVNMDEILVDTNGASSNITISLPASPSAGDQVRVVLITEHATRICLISRNGSSIDGRTTTEGETYYTLWKNGDNITFKYVGGSTGWSGINRNIVNRFAFMAYGSANTNLTFNTFVTCLFDTVIYDYNNSYTTASYKYTIPITGLWCFNAKIMGNGLTDQKRFISEFYKNNTTTVYTKYDTANGTQVTNADMTYYVNAVAGDYYVIRVFNDLNPSTGKYVYGGNSSLTNWSGYLVSR